MAARMSSGKKPSTRSARLTVDRLTSAIADTYDQAHLRKNGLGALELEPDAPSGRYSVDRIAQVRGLGNQITEIRKVVSDAATFACLIHGGDLWRQDRDEKARNYLTDARGLASGLRGLLKHNSMYVHDGLGVLGLTDINFKRMNDAASVLLYAIKKMPKAPPRSVGARSLRFAEAYAGFAAHFWLNQFGALPPKSRTGWFVEFLVHSWADLGLPADWPGLDDFHSWMGERVIAGLGRYSVELTADGFKLKTSLSEKRRISPDDDGT